MYSTDLMIDNETLGTLADSVILSIGACRFDAWRKDVIDDDGFYVVINIDSQVAAGRHIDPDTLKWWMGQSAAAQAVFHDPSAKPLDEALEMFVEWVGKRETHPWSMGADFDLPMLAHALKTRGFDVPWKFWDSWCVRTYKKLPGAAAVYDATERLGTHHNALHDAIHQARAVQNINAALFPTQKRRPIKPKPAAPKKTA